MRKSRLLATLLMLSGVAVAGCKSVSDEQPKVGDISEQELLTTFPIFNQAYDAFSLSERDKRTIDTWPENLTIDVYFGTWCHDSEREVPRLLKLLDYYPSEKLTMVALDYQKQDPKGLAKQNGVRFTPTIIVKLEGVEVGRIIERPASNLIGAIDLMIKKHLS